MGIESRLRDALTLWCGSRREGSLLLVLVAVAATARLRYPASTRSCRDPGKSMGDGEAFETYFNEELPNIADIGTLNIAFNGKDRTLGWVLYKWFRCALFHEAALAPEVSLVPSPRPGMLLVTNKSGLPPRVEITDALVVLLADLVCRSKENISLPRDVREEFIKHASGT